MLNIVCVNWQNYQGRGVEYVNLLNDMVRRNLSANLWGRFVCFTDNIEQEGYDKDILLRKLPEGIHGWFNKLYLFCDGLFDDGDRIMYLDLDCCITGGLDDIASYAGDFAILEDVFTGRYNSSVMLWKQRTCGTSIWQAYLDQRKPATPGGDQEFIWDNTAPADSLQLLFPGCFKSYRVEAQFNIPTGCKVVYFHGQPKPHEVTDGWPTLVWKRNGISLFDNKVVGNTEDNTIITNIKDALAKGYEMVRWPKDANTSHVVIVGGGPSVAEHIDDIRTRSEQGQLIVALNGAFEWLVGNHIDVDYHVLMDARPENIRFLPPVGVSRETKQLYCAQCDPALLAAAKNLSIWLPYADGMVQALDDYKGAYVGGGSTVGLRALSLFWLLGMRAFHLYGYDSSYRNAEHHAYEQNENNGERLLTVQVGEEKFTASPWMATQAQEFRDLAFQLINADGCEITVHGDGLLPTVAQRMTHRMPVDTIHQVDGEWWPVHDIECQNSVRAHMNDVKIILAHVPLDKRRVCVQAGGNVGMWPKELVNHFERLYTFEPDPINYRCMHLNLLKIDRITVQNAALGDKSGKSGITSINGNCGAHFLDGDGDIPIITIDSLGLGACDLIQLDVEGYEYQALLGARETIEKFHPTIVTEEKGLGEKYGYSDHLIGTFLAGLGYTVATKVARDVIYTHQPQT